MKQNETPISTAIEPWLTAQNAARAIEFYKAAFNSVETYRLEAPDGGLVVKLSVNGAGFWLSGGSSENEVSTIINDGTIRMILTVSDPDDIFSKALQAGASEVFPVGEQFGWRLGRLSDPFGFHWEIGHPLS